MNARLFAGWQARDLLAQDPRQTSFALFFVATLGGNLLLILAADLAGFYFGYALMTFAAYGLVVHKGSPEAWQAGRVYLVMALLAAGFGIKAGALARHTGRRPAVALVSCD